MGECSCAAAAAKKDMETITTAVVVVCECVFGFVSQTTQIPVTLLCTRSLLLALPGVNSSSAAAAADSSSSSVCGRVFLFTRRLFFCSVL